MAKKNDEECPWCQFLTWAKDSETTQHLRNARKELLMAVRSAVEAGLERLDVEETKPTKAKPKSRGRARKVKIG